MTTVIRTHKSSSKGLWIAMAISALVAIALAFYLTAVGRDDSEVAQAPSVAASVVSDAGAAADTAADRAAAAVSR